MERERKRGKAIKMLEINYSSVHFYDGIFFWYLTICFMTSALKKRSFVLQQPQKTQPFFVHI